MIVYYIFNIYFKPPRDAVVHFNAMALLSICSSVCLETAKHILSSKFCAICPNIRILFSHQILGRIPKQRQTQCGYETVADLNKLVAVCRKQHIYSYTTNTVNTSYQTFSLQMTLNDLGSFSRMKSFPGPMSQRNIACVIRTTNTSYARIIMSSVVFKLKDSSRSFPVT